ncbi:hypothetical protein [Pseudonocardia spinosispora]|uniref:hypothetical protein n=1 Tax=Pseudonocardia spinosispora TaxID=103441 RepID=UPI000418CA9D|nr:hypothetical protein [Pseudonocardia spinosispora]
MSMTLSHHVAALVGPPDHLLLVAVRLTCLLERMRNRIRRRTAEAMGHGQTPPNDSWPLEDQNDLWSDDDPTRGGETADWTADGFEPATTSSFSPRSV